MKIVVSPAIAVSGRPAGPLGRPLEGYTPPEDASAVRLLKAAGAEIAGTPKCAELAFGLAGDTTAETLKETGATAALGLDTLGEVRLAAAAAGLIGYRPSRGIFSRSGVVGLIPSMETIGVLAEDVSIIREVAALLAVPDPEDSSMLQEGLPDFRASLSGPARIGVIKECRPDLPPDTARFLEERGCAVTEVSLPDYELFSLVHRIVGSVEASSAAGNYDGVRFGRRAKAAENWNEMYLRTRGGNFIPPIKSYLFSGAWYQFKDYVAFEAAARLRRRLAGAAAKLVAELDFLVLPALGTDPGKAKTVAETYQAFRHTLPANVLGFPAVALPGGDRGPGLQLLGPRLSDGPLLEQAARLTRKGER